MKKFLAASLAAFLLFTVALPFLLTSTVTISSCIRICACRKSCSIHPDNVSKASSAVIFS